MDSDTRYTIYCSNPRTTLERWHVRDELSGRIYDYDSLTDALDWVEYYYGAWPEGEV